MRAKLSTVAVIAIVGGVVVAALLDSLNGHFASHPPASAGPPASAPRATAQVQSGGSATATLVDVGVRSHRIGGPRIRVIAERLRFGPGIGAASGERIAMWAWNPSRPAVDGIYTRDAAGGALERVTVSPRGRVQTPLAYSAGGIGILFYQDGRNHGAGALYVVRADATHRVRLTPPGMTSECCDLGHPAAWGPDGRVAFAAFAAGAAGRGGRSALYVANADGSRPRRITPEAARITAPRWSPDGRFIAFDRIDRPGGADDLFVVHPNGTGLHAVTGATLAAVLGR